MGLEMGNAALALKGIIAAVGGGIAYWLGGLDQLLAALLAVIALDYLTGLLKAVHRRALSSEIGFKGIAKKVFCLVLVALAFVVEGLTAEAMPLREMVIVFFIANEGISILENAAQTGLPIPAKLQAVLAQLKGKGERDADTDPAPK